MSTHAEWRDVMRRGEDKPGHRLTEDQVRAILTDPRASRGVGAEYGVSHTAVQRIRRSERWAHVG